MKSVVPVFIFLGLFAASLPVFAALDVSLSSEKLEQGDALFLSIKNLMPDQSVSGKLGLTKLNFYFDDILKEWRAIVGVDAKKTVGNYSLTISSGADKYKKLIKVSKRKFPTTSLFISKDLKSQGYSAKAIANDVLNIENPTLNKILGFFLPEKYFKGGFVYPLSSINVVGAYGNIRKENKTALQHLGVDLEAKINTPIFAVNDGTVRLEMELGSYGKTIVIDHGFGIFSLYLHLNKFSAALGEKVKKGDIVGESGNTGYSLEPHLHFAIKINGASVDPLKFIELSQRNN